MRLELDSIKIKDIQESSATAIKDGVLYLNKKELEEELLKDEKIKSLVLAIKPESSAFRMLCSLVAEKMVTTSLVLLTKCRLLVTAEPYL